MQSRQIRSALDSVVLILSAILFALLGVVSCKSEIRQEPTPMTPPPLGRNIPRQLAVPPPPPMPDIEPRPGEAPATSSSTATTESAGPPAATST